MVMKGGLVSQVGSGETLAPKFTGGERQSMAYRTGFGDRVAIFASAPCMLQLRANVAPTSSRQLCWSLQAVSTIQAVFSSDNFGG
jgi:hypothetical protein